MKKSFMYLMLVFTFLFGAAATVSAQSKALQKDVKKRVKELKKEGWNLQASTSTLDYAMLQYRTYLEEDMENRLSLTGIAVGKNIKIGRENAITNAISSYAGRARAQIVGKLRNIMATNGGDISEDEIDKFGAAYESSVNTRISGLVRQHFVLVRDLSDGQKEFNVFLSLDELKAKKAREEAAREAEKKSALGQLTKDVQDFIGEPIELD